MNENILVQRTEWEQMRTSLNKVAEFVALFESAEEKLYKREEALKNSITENEEHVERQLGQIRGVLNNFHEMMTEAGAARWRIAADQSLRAGDEHLKNIRLATGEFIRKTEESYKKLDKTAEYTVKGISKAIYSFRIDDFHQMTNNSIEQLQETCDKTITKINKVVRWFQWRNIGILFAMTLVVSMVSGLYLNDQWPWEMHHKVMEQRNLAHSVVSAWSHLSVVDQQAILQGVGDGIS